MDSEAYTISESRKQNYF